MALSAVGVVVVTTAGIQLPVEVLSVVGPVVAVAVAVVAAVMMDVEKGTVAAIWYCWCRANDDDDDNDGTTVEVADTVTILYNDDVNVNNRRG